MNWRTVIAAAAWGVVVSVLGRAAGLPMFDRWALLLAGAVVISVSTYKERDK